MLSGVKNFFLTFIIALVIFGLAASAVLGIVINNINVSLEAGGEEAETTAPDGQDAGEVTPSEQIQDNSKSLNILIIGSDYREGVFADYDPEVLEDLYGIKQETVLEQAPPSDVEAPSADHASGIVSDEEEKSTEGIKISDDTLVFEGGFYSVSYRQIEADTVVLLRFDRERSQVSYSVFPTDAYMLVNGSYMKFSEIYGTYGADIFCDAVHSLTGIRIDRYCVLTLDTFPDVIDALGGVDFTVPCKMKYDDYAGNVHINLNSGLQHLDGNAALQLLMYNSYTDVFNTRQKTTISFVRTLISSMASPATIIRLPAAFRQLQNMVQTNLTVTDITDNISTAIVCAANAVEIEAVTVKQTVNGEKNAQVFDMSATYNTFARYKRIYN